MVERAVDGPEEGAAVRFAIGVGEAFRGGVDLFVHPPVVASHHANVLGHHDPPSYPRSAWAPKARASACALPEAGLHTATYHAPPASLDARADLSKAKDA